LLIFKRNQQLDLRPAGYEPYGDGVGYEFEGVVLNPLLLEFGLERTSTRRVRLCEISTGTYDPQVISPSGDNNQRKPPTNGDGFLQMIG